MEPLYTYRTKDKIVDLPTAVQKVHAWRVYDDKIVFTNGCFDLLHLGHITLLEEAAALGDKLIVGLNSDHSVKQIKGEKRPLFNQQERARLLAALEFVDLVVIFDESTPEKLIHALRPDVLVKGADYTIENVVGASFVQSYGGEVKLLPLVENYSTTQLIQRICKNHG